MKKSLILGLAAVIVLLHGAEIPPPWGGALELAGTGKFCCQKAILPLKPGQSYRFDGKICKVPPVSAQKTETRLVLYSVDKGKFVKIVSCGDDVPADGKFHPVAKVFTVPESAKGAIQLYAYNCNAAGTLKIADFQIVPLTASGGAAPAGTVEIRPALGNREPALLRGNGKFLHRQEDLKLQRGQTYTAEVLIRKTGSLSPKSSEHRLMLAVRTPDGKTVEFARAGADVPADGFWHKAVFNFTVPEQPGRIVLYVYNCNSSGTLEIQDVVFRPQKAAK